MTYEGMLAETVRVQGHNDDTIDAYLARPFGAGPYPGVVLIHHMPGWDEASKEMARKFAYNGYACISPSLHHRAGPGSVSTTWPPGFGPKAVFPTRSASVTSTARYPTSVRCRTTTAKLA